MGLGVSLLHPHTLTPVFFFSPLFASTVQLGICKEGEGGEPYTPVLPAAHSGNNWLMKCSESSERGGGRSGVSKGLNQETQKKVLFSFFPRFLAWWNMRNARARVSAAIKDFKIPPSQSVRTRQRFHTSFSKSICPTTIFPQGKKQTNPLKVEANPLKMQMLLLGRGPPRDFLKSWEKEVWHGEANSTVVYISKTPKRGSFGANHKSKL